MPAHVQMECKKTDCGGSCNACNLQWCSVCGGGEVELTIDCIGRKMTEEQVVAVSEGRMDYTDARGWYERADAHAFEASPRFAP